MPVLYASILAAILLFPLAFAEGGTASRCRPDELCLPAELRLTSTQAKELGEIRERSRRQREALERQARHDALRLLTPAQRAQLARRDGPDS